MGDDHDGRDTIYLIESPNAVDLLKGRNEGNALAETLALADIDVEYYLVTSKETFDFAIDEIAIRINTDPLRATSMPYVHISAHGSEDGIELTDGDVLYWETLYRSLTYLHSLVGGVEFVVGRDSGLPRLSVCLSSCQAFVPFVKHAGKDAPFQAAIGPTRDIGWCEALIAFSTFYYQTMILRRPLQTAKFSMNIASGAVFAMKIDETERDPSVYQIFEPQHELDAFHSQLIREMRGE